MHFAPFATLITDNPLTHILSNTYKRKINKKKTFNTVLARVKDVGTGFFFLFFFFGKITWGRDRMYNPPLARDCVRGFVFVCLIFVDFFLKKGGVALHWYKKVPLPHRDCRFFFR